MVRPVFWNDRVWRDWQAEIRTHRLASREKDNAEPTVDEGPTAPESSGSDEPRS